VESDLSIWLAGIRAIVIFAAFSGFRLGAVGHAA
jgi:hypothetical protein